MWKKLQKKAKKELIKVVKEAGFDLPDYLPKGQMVSAVKERYERLTNALGGWRIVSEKEPERSERIQSLISTINVRLERIREMEEELKALCVDNYADESELQELSEEIVSDLWKDGDDLESERLQGNLLVWRDEFNLSGLWENTYKNLYIDKVQAAPVDELNRIHRAVIRSAK